MPSLRSPLPWSSGSNPRSCSPLPSPFTMAFRNDNPSGRGLWRPRFVLPIVFVIAMFGLWRSSRLASFSKSNLGFGASSKPGHEAFDQSFSDIQNSTLGVSPSPHYLSPFADWPLSQKFEKLFILNLPSRPDKRDAFVLTASISGFKVEIIDGVDGATVPDKALPFDATKMGDARNRGIGSWRAHINVLRKIVEDGISSAMIFEDDTDWDVSIKTQLSQIAQGTRYLSKDPSSPSKIPHSPYGDWDLFWPGHCGTGFDPESSRFIIDNDPSVPAPKHRVNYGGKPNMTSYSDNARAVFEASEGCCTFAYALSYRGAQKLLHRQNTRTAWGAYDLDVSDMCRDDPHFKCLSVFPQIINSHGAAGPINRDSDLSVVTDTNVRKKGFTHNVVTSARLNIANLLQGKEPELQNPEDKPNLEGPVRFWVDEMHEMGGELDVGN